MARLIAGAGDDGCQSLVFCIGKTLEKVSCVVIARLESAMEVLPVQPLRGTDPSC